MKTPANTQGIKSQEEIINLVNQKINTQVEIVEHNPNSKKPPMTYTGKIIEIYKNMFILQQNNGLKKSFLFVDFSLGLYYLN